MDSCANLSFKVILAKNDKKCQLPLNCVTSTFGIETQLCMRHIFFLCSTVVPSRYTILHCIKIQNSFSFNCGPTLWNKDVVLARNILYACAEGPTPRLKVRKCTHSCTNCSSLIQWGIWYDVAQPFKLFQNSLLNKRTTLCTRMCAFAYF